MKKKYITDFAWNKIMAFLGQQKNIYFISESKMRNFFESIFWVVRTGAQWREVPEYYGKWNSIFSRFNDWSVKKIWDNFLDFCIEDPDLEYVVIDATIIRAHACSSGYGDPAKEGLGRSKGGYTTKVHVKTDALGNPLKVVITPGQRHDVTQAEALLEGVHGAYVLGDKAYGAAHVRQKIHEQNCVDVIPSRSNSKSPVEYDEEIYKERHVIECFFSKIKFFRRIFSRFDKSARNFASFISFVGAIIWLR